MAVTIYKKGQGYWTRMMSAVGYGLIVGLGVIWLWDLLKSVKIGGLESVYISAAGAVIAASVFGVLGYYLIGVKPRVVDFMIATEGEMKKVNWSSRKEVLGSTWVVIGLTFFIAVFCALVDLGFASFFRAIDVLDKQ